MCFDYLRTYLLNRGFMYKVFEFRFSRVMARIKREGVYTKEDTKVNDLSL